MKIELRKISYNARLSEETSAFAADVYIDGKKAGTARNAGHGGSTDIDPHALWEKLAAHAKTLPPIVSDTLADPNDKSKPFSYQPDAETVIDDLLHEWLCARDLTSALRRKVVHIHEGKIYETGVTRMKPADILAHPKFRASIKGVILNEMPFDDALALYRKRGK